MHSLVWVHGSVQRSLASCTPAFFGSARPPHVFTRARLLQSLHPACWPVGAESISCLAPTVPFFRKCHVRRVLDCPLMIRLDRSDLNGQSGRRLSPLDYMLHPLAPVLGASPR